MAIARHISINFWNDSKVDDEFTPEDKYFMLYLLTNPHTSLCGCYEIGFKAMERETGYSEDSVRRILKRLEQEHEVIKYCNETKEILILNWGKYNWGKSEKLIAGVIADAEDIKNEAFKKYVIAKANGEEAEVIEDELVEQPEQIDLFDDAPIEESPEVNTCPEHEVIDYLNQTAGTHYTYSKGTVKHIRARLQEGHTRDDCMSVISKKWKDWEGTEYEKYINPETLFRPANFEKYLNQRVIPKQQAKGGWF